MNAIVTKIMDAVKKAHNNELGFEELFLQDAQNGKNQFLMFVKPEVLLNSSKLKTKEMIELVLKKVEEFGLKVHNIKALGAKYLDENNIIAQHYGVINKLANDAKNTLSQSAKEKFKEIFEKDINEVKVIGGFEFLNEYKEFTPYTLDILWQAQVSKKLAGGTYAEMIKVDDETVYVINGFHPRQLHHFSQSGRSIIVLTVSGDTSWEKSRDDMIGNTFPERATKGSIRSELLAQKDFFGMPDVSILNNGIHLSAGPIEGLIELVRYNSNFSDKAKLKTAKDFAFGKKLYDSFDDKTVEKILSNPNVDVDGKSVSVFDLTEMKDSDEALEILKKYF